MSCIAEDRSRYDKRKQGECNASVETERGTTSCTMSTCTFDVQRTCTIRAYVFFDSACRKEWYDA